MTLTSFKGIDMYDDFCEDFLDEFREKTLLTNFNKNLRGMYQKAIDIYESKFPQFKGCFYIKEEAYNIHAVRLDHLLSLHLADGFRGNTEDFWNIAYLVELDVYWLALRNGIRSIIIKQALRSDRYKTDAEFQAATNVAKQWYISTFGDQYWS